MEGASFEHLSSNRNKNEESDVVDSNTENGVSRESFRKKVYFTIAVYYAVYSIGVTCSILGPSLIDLQELYQISTSSVVVLFTCVSTGYLTGSLIGGYLFTKLNDQFYFFLSTSCLAITFGASPWLPHFVVFCAVMSVGGVCQGLLEVACHVYVMSTWKSSKHMESLTLLVSVIWSLGSTTAPFLVEPFLSLDNPLLEVNNSTTNTTLFDSTDVIPPFRGTRVAVGITVAALVTSVGAFLCGTAFCFNGMRYRREHSTNLDVHKKQELSRSFKIGIAVFSVSLYFFYVGLEQCLGNLLTTYVVEGLKWDKYKGPLITSIMWGVFGFSQVVTMFLTKIFTSVKIVISHTVLVCVAYIVLSTMAHFHETVVWVCVVTIGYGHGPFFHCAMLVINKYVVVDGFMSCAMVSGACVSMMATVPLVGYIYATYGKNAMIYTMTALAFATLFDFIGMVLFARRYQISKPHPHTETNVSGELSTSSKLELTAISDGHVINDNAPSTP